MSYTIPVVHATRQNATFFFFFLFFQKGSHQSRGPVLPVIYIEKNNKITVNSRKSQDHTVILICRKGQHGVKVAIPRGRGLSGPRQGRK